MPAMPIPKHVIVTGLAALLVLCLGATGARQRPAADKPIVVEVHRLRGRLTFKLTPNPAPGEDILWGLTALAKERGTDHPVVALIDDDAQIKDLQQVSGIAAKAGFQSTRTFIVNVEIGKMTEIRFCPAVSVSAGPPPESTCDSSR